MPTYFYLAKTFSGETKKGQQEAKSSKELAEALRSEGLILINATTEKDQKKDGGFSFFGPSLSEKNVFYQKSANNDFQRASFDAGA